MDINITIEQLIQQRVKEICSKKKIPNIQNIIETDNIGDVIDKLCVVHIRIWMLEDLAGMANNAEYVELKRKLDICFKQIRPNLVEAINKLIDKAIIFNKNSYGENIKIYKGDRT